MTEVWKPIKGYEGLYLVSNNGKVKSLDRVVQGGRGPRVHKGKELKPAPNSRGYMRVSLSDANGIKTRLFVHRLVAEAFVLKPVGCDVVNHLDFDYQNNRADNLEWTTQRGNMTYSVERGRFEKNPAWREAIRRGLAVNCARPVVGIDLNSGETREFRAIRDVSQAGFDPPSVCNCCKGVRATHAGHEWRYAP